MDLSKTLEKVRDSIGLIFVIKEGRVVGKGSGFVFWKEDVIVTCNHVIKGDGVEVKIQFPDLPSSQFIDATILIRDEEHDLALLKINGRPRKVLSQTDKSEIREGMPVMFSGYPLTLTNLTTHQGILSAIVADEFGMTTYLIDGTVNSGNSGCPLMNVDGDVIGVVNAKRREQNNVLNQVENMQIGALSLHQVDLVNILNALTSNVQLGIGYAVPVSYITKHKDVKISE